MAAADGTLRIATATTEFLDLQRRGLAELPPEVTKLTNLSTLNLAGNQLGTLPAEIGQLTNLRTLNLAGNQLGTLPAEIGQLTNLSTLNLAGNQLGTLPAEIGQLTNLRTLNLAGNQLGTLPAEIGQLTNLRTLYVARNQFATLPPGIAKLTSLAGLHMARNQLATLPAEIGQLTNLSTLDLKDNRLTILPPEIGQLFRLAELYLRNNRLTMQQLEICQLTSLRTLSLGDNQLTELQPDICRMTRLRELRLGGNKLTTLPAELGRLTNLSTLDLRDNQLTTLPAEIGRLTSLQELDVSGNQLTTLPAEIGRLTSLQELDVSGNQLTTLPAETGQLVRLRKLDLKSNQLTALPSKLADLLLGGLRPVLQDNPLNDPLPEFISRGLDSLVTYLRSLEDAIAHYEAKVLLVGEGNVGKTSLVAALRDEPFMNKRETTHGIEIHPLIMRHPALRTDMIVRAWDFGGQPIYRITHQFFFSRRALYLVVWNAREGHEQNEVEGWLRRVRLRVSYDARVLIVATHCDECRPELDYPDLKRIFSGLLVGSFEVDNRTGRGISELNVGIAEAVSQLPHMGQLISLRWLAARDEILAHAETEPQIPYRQFVEICKRHYVEDDQIVMLAKMMHDLGQIVYYADDEGLRDFVVLDPEWLTKAISYVLEDEPTRKADGVLEHARLPDIWQNRQGRLAYPTRYYPYFLRLMEKFDVSYRLEDDEYRSLVAQLVPHNRPDLPWDTRTPPRSGTRRLSLICQLSEPVPGLVAWLTVRHHSASTGKHWRNGVFFRHPISAYASEALLELQTPDQLVVDVRAPSPDLFFNVVRYSIEDLITRRWPGLTYQLLIPCPNRDTSGLSCNGHFPLKFLLGYRERGGTRVPCQECLTELDVSELLTGFAQPDLPLQIELERLHDKSADIGSNVKSMEGGISRLESYAADAADSMRRVLKIVGSEITDCPLLFTLTAENPSGARRLRFYEHHYRLTLWCEHPGHWHPWSAASYPIDQPREWLARIGPYAVLLFKALQVVVPIADAVTKLVPTPKGLQRAQQELDLMKTLVDDLPTEIVEESSESIVGGFTSRLTLAQHQSARALRLLLFQKDPRRAFGDLRRVQAPSGDFVWVCAEHYSYYDPGLPSIPLIQP